ncbi:hypothetical protein [Bordetella hinzii]|uniref:hypothetical protein n=1 Tax=Bordetella hinzii TaxID=103855 RepID=UPI000519D8EF|nr:hypothetical protein [Bordetella hinzii]KXA74438.1 hypothetical protein AXA74_03170 [Bordetella hinzii LMG 13501]QDJ35718.1 hypothetical protein CBR67_03125 [Bordetella hinzii]
MKLEQIMNQDDRETLDMYAQACMAVRKNDGVLYPRIAIITGDFFPMMTDALTTEQWQSAMKFDPRIIHKDAVAMVFAVGGVVVPDMQPQEAIQWQLDNEQRIGNHPQAIPACSFVVKFKGGKHFYPTGRIEKELPELQWSASPSEGLYDCPVWEDEDE